MKWPAISPTTIIPVLVGFGVCALLAWALWPNSTLSVTPGTEQAAPLPPAVQEAPRVTIPDTATPTAPPMSGVAKTPALRQKTKLPPAMFDAPETYITATGALQSEDDRAYTLTSLLDRRTGETQVYAVADPLPWFSLATDHGAASLHYGLRDGEPIFRGTLSQEVFRIKQARVGGLAQLDSDGEWFAGLGVQLRW